MPVIWNDEKHAIGIPAIDEQHKSLFVIVNELFDVSGELDVNDRQRRLIALFKRLFAYAKFHFASEENLFKTWNYSERLTHQTMHHDFSEKIKAWLEDSRVNPRFNIAMPLDYLVHWIVHHIQEEDIQYAWEFQKRGLEVQLHTNGPGVPAGTEMLALWEDKQLAVGLHDIDQQHLELVHILQQVNDLSRNSLNRQRAILPEIIQKLFYYSQYHFTFEEELMSRSRWSGLAAHREMHRTFIKAVMDVTTAYNQRQWAGMTDTLIVWLKDWTVHHILEEDRSFLRTLQSSRSR